MYLLIYFLLELSKQTIRVIPYKTYL